MKLLPKNRDADEKLVKAGHYKRKAEKVKEPEAEVTIRKAETARSL